MKAMIKHALKLPDMGDRSRSTIGVSLMMHHSMFAECSSRGCRRRTYQPICKEFAAHTKEQLEMRDQLTESMIRQGYTKDECLNEWASIVKECTESATLAFLEYYGETIVDYVMPSVKTNRCLRKAAVHGIAEMTKQVNLRMRGHGSNLAPTPLLDFGDDTQSVVYVYLQRRHSKETTERKVYKIGYTTNIRNRHKAHSTSNTDLALVVTIPTSSAITERAIHQLFREHRLTLEWFLLTDDDIAILKDRTRLAAAIAKLTDTA